MKKTIFFSMMLLTVVSMMTAQEVQRFPWLDRTKSFHERAIMLVDSLTLREKVDQLGNIVSEDIVRKDANGQDYIILPHYQYWNEALHGVLTKGDKRATSFPTSKSMSASWDRELIYDCASIVSDEARWHYLDNGKGLDYWSPTINMSRDPRWGRDEENYGEDPFLTSELAVPFVRAFQGANFDGTRNTDYLKLVACAKHFAANNYEAGRQSTTSFVTEKNMREYYLPAFEACVREADVKSVMAAYNAFSIDPTETDVIGRGYTEAHGGLPCPANKMLLTDILRKEWGFSGYVTSDCAAIACIHRWVKHGYFGNYTEGTLDDSPAFVSIHDPYDNATTEQILNEARSTAIAIKAGCNMNCEFMNRSAVYQRAGVNATTPAFQANDPLQYVTLTEEDIDSALVQILETRFALGEFEPSECPWNSGVAIETTDHQQMAIKAAQECMTLLKNENNFLPLSTTQSVALIGPYADAIMLGDYSGIPSYKITPFQAFAQKLNFVTPKNEFRSCDIAAVPFDSAVVSQRGAGNNDKGAGNLENTAPGDIFLYKNVWFGEGVTDFVMTCGSKDNGLCQVSFILDDKDNEPFLTVNNKNTGNWTAWDTVQATIDPTVVQGTHDLYVRFIGIGTNKYCGNYKSFTFSNPTNPVTEPIPAIETVGPLYMYSPSTSVNDVWSDAEIARAVAVAQRADVVIFLTGTNFEKKEDHATGTESHDRVVIALPGNQEQVLEALYAANPNTVLVLESGSSLDITWAKANVPAIMEAWYGGQAQGQAICDALYGDINPSGKLTSTWYNSLDELPNRADEQAENPAFRRDQHGMMFYDIDTWGYTYMYYGKAKHQRQAAAPLYPFGYGLSYTTFAYSNLQAPASIAADGTINVTATITNTGTRDGAEIVQLYANWNGQTENGKKNRKLIGFERVEIPAGQSVQVTFPVKYEQFSYFNTTTHRYEVEAANVTLELAASSADIRQTATITTAAGVAKETYISNPDSGAAIETVESKDQLLQTDHIYTVLGAYVGKAEIFDTLPSGIYVLNGVKYFKK